MSLRERMQADVRRMRERANAAADPLFAPEAAARFAATPPPTG
jgi:hypothetical protein